MFSEINHFIYSLMSFVWLENQNYGCVVSNKIIHQRKRDWGINHNRTFQMVLVWGLRQKKGVAVKSGQAKRCWRRVTYCSRPLFQQKLSQVGWSRLIDRAVLGPTCSNMLEEVEFLWFKYMLLQLLLHFPLCNRLPALSRSIWCWYLKDNQVATSSICLRDSTSPVWQT